MSSQFNPRHYWRNGALALLAGLALAAPAMAQEGGRIYTQANAPKAPQLADLPLKTSVSHFGVTWTFEKPAPVGQFVNGDWYVVGPVTVIKIDPQPLSGDQVKDPSDTEKTRYHGVFCRNGFMLDPPPKLQRSAFDSRMPHPNSFQPDMLQKLPVAMKPGDALMSAISKDQLGNSGLPIKSFSVLTCLKEPVPADAFRPGYSDRQQTIYLARNLHRQRLPNLAPPNPDQKLSTPLVPELKHCEDLFSRPWNHMAILEDAEAEYQFGGYGRSICQWVSNATLLLCLDYKPEQKEPLLIDMVEQGLDLWGFCKTDGFAGWPTLGGWGSGRKWPIIFAGLMLGDDQMANPVKTYPRLSFQEDNQTHDDDCWTGAGVVYAGHVGWNFSNPVKRGLGAGPFENVHPSRWSEWEGTSYRTNMTSSTWVGEALAIRILQAEKEWDDPAFLNYCDRWMYEPDPGYRNPERFSTQGCAYDAFQEAMWKTYRENLPTIAGCPNAPRPTTGWQKKRELKGPEVTVGKNRELIVKGQPMLPIMIFAEQPGRIDDAQAIGANVIAEGCFEKADNAPQYWSLNTHDPALIGTPTAKTYERIFGVPWAVSTTNKEFLDALAAKGMYGIFGADARAIGHPALLGWIHVDEPDVLVQQAAGLSAKQLRHAIPNLFVMENARTVGAPAELKGMADDLLLVQPAYEWMKHVDASRPVFLTVGPAFLQAAADGKKDYCAGYLKNCDAIGCAVYPLTQEGSRQKMVDVANAVSTLVELAPGKPVYAWIETRMPVAPAPAKGTPAAAPQRASLKVTPADVRAEVWMAIIRGATGIGYRGFEGFKDITLDPAMTAELKRLDDQITALAPAILAPPAKGQVQMSLANQAASHVKATDLDGATTIFAQNLGDAGTDTGKATIKVDGLKAGTRIEVVDENRTLTAADGSFTDDFAPLAEHVYRLKL